MLSAAEQLLIEMINRTRLDPEGEAARFGIDLNEGLDAGTLDGSARQVLAPNELLSDAADAHGAWMLEKNTFSHTGIDGSSPGDRMLAAGYEFSGRYASGENITYRGTTGTIDLNALMEENHHEDLFLSAGHRANMLHDFYSEIGVSQTGGVFTSGSQSFNASMVVENFALSGSDVFLTGVSYTDSDEDDFYSIGEGRAGVQIQAAGQSTQTQTAGGYAIALTAASDVVVTLGSIGLLVDLSEGNGKLDLVNVDDVNTSVDTTLTSAAGSLRALGVGDIDLTGHDGVDVLIGNQGDNILDGGAGTDTVLYDLDFSDVTITQGEGSITVVTAGLGTDTLLNIETIVFNDQSVTFESAEENTVTDVTYTGDMLVGDAQDDVLYGDGFSVAYAPEVSAQVYRLYQAALGRSPDHSGHANWTETLFQGNLALSDVAAGFVSSLEFQKSYGTFDTANFVDLLYQNVLGRSADAGGRANWISRIDENGITQAEAVLGFSESIEFTASTEASATQFIEEHTQQEWSDDVFRLYQATLGRNPDQTGFTAWANRASSGTDFSDIVEGFVSSAEFQKNYGDLDNGSFVELLYNNVLERGSDAAGLAGWLDALDGGRSRAQVVEAFAQSSEFVNNSASVLRDWMLAQGTDDVIAAGSGDNVLAGGLMSDVFVFNADWESSNEVLDLEAWDVLRFEGFGYDDVSAVFAHLSEVDDAVSFVDQGVSISFANTSLDMISDDMIQI
jgi:hypothetical protein